MSVSASIKKNIVVTHNLDSRHSMESYKSARRVEVISRWNVTHMLLEITYSEENTQE